MEGNEPPVDLATVLDRIDGDKELLAELVALYLDDEQRLLGEIDQALASKDAAALRRSAHTLKGAVANFCAPRAQAVAQALENAGRDGSLDKAATLLSSLRAEFTRVREALSAAGS